jgi:outer membrane lipoprotein-sorting protein
MIVLMKYLISTVFLSSLISLQVFASGKVDRILQKMDRLYKSDSSIATMQMSVINPDWQRQMKLKAWTNGLEQSFITILYPNKDKGISTLKKNKQMWNYFPKINKVIKIPPSMMMGSWMGSDFTNDDLVKENTYQDDYSAKMLQEDESQYYIELTPRAETVTVWGKVVLTVEKKRTIPLKEIFYNEKGEQVRIITFDKVQKVQNKELPMRLTLESLKKKGHKTIVEYIDVKFDMKLPDNIFSLRNLKKRR